MHKSLPAFLLAVALAPAAVAQQITPVWVQHINGLVNVTPDNKLPILVKAGGTGDNTYGFSGADVIDSYISFTKYDDNYYLLGVRENGINETDENLSQDLKDRAAAFPDRSVIWIDAATGKPLGVALKTEVLPVALATQGTTHAWWKFGIQDGPHGERAIYTGYKYKILRYAPDALVDDPNFPNKRPTWSATPTEAWVEPVPSEPSGDGSSGGDGSASWRWKHMKVYGAGNDTVLWIGGGTWRASMQPQELHTTDGGLTFQANARLNDRNDNRGEKGQYAQGGEPSGPVAWPLDSARPDLKVAYHPHYPGAGWDARPTRHTRNPGGNGTLPREGGTGRPNFYEYDHAGSDTFPAFNWEAAAKDGIPISHAVDGVSYYDGNWVLACETKEGLDYVVTYAIPSWNQVFGNAGTPGAIFKPGWIGLHTLNGLISSGQAAYKIPVYETDEPIVDPNGNGGTGHDYGYDGDLNVFPVAGAPANSGESLIFWSGGVYGFGVFKAQNVAAQIVTPPANTSVTENKEVSLVAVVSGSPNLYQWYKGEDALVAGAAYRVSLTEGVNKAKLTLLNAQVSDSGTYVLKIKNPLGDLETAPVTLTIDTDNVKPKVASTASGRSADGSFFKVTYDEKVTPETAGEPNNYKLSGGVVVSGAVAVSPTAAVVWCSTLQPDIEYTLTINSVKDIAATPNTIELNTKAKIKGPKLTTGFLLWEEFRGFDNAGIDGTSTDALYANGCYPTSPVRWERMTAATTGADGLSNVADRFGGRISGWITPTVAGQYRFFISGDDSSDLYLSDSEDPAGAIAPIAYDKGCCQPFAEPDAADPENKGSKLTSDAITLEANKSYYIAMVYKEGTGGDNGSIAWRKEGDATPAANLTPIPGSFFKSYQTYVEPPKFQEPTIQGNELTISWTGTGVLMETMDFINWVPIPNAPNPYKVTVSPDAGAKFYGIGQ